MSAETGGKKYEKLLDYEEVEVLEIKPNGVRIKHKWGARFIPRERLPENVRNELGLTDEYAEEGRKKIEEKRRVKKLVAAAKGAQVELRGTVFQVLGGGILINDAYELKSEKRKVKYRESYKVRTGGPSALRPNAKVKYETRYRDAWRWTTDTDRRDFGMVFVKCDPGGYIDGHAFSGVVYPFGTFTYTTAIGGTKTVEKCTMSSTEYLTSVGLLK